VRYNDGVTPPPNVPARTDGVDDDPERIFGPLLPGDLPSELAVVALRAGRAAATLLADAVGRPRDEALITGILEAARPDDGLLGEEGASKAGTSGVRWVIDPLDGTTNFLFGVPQYSVSIAAEIAGDPVVGVVIDPSRGEIWAARQGGGARCNGIPCRVADGRSTLDTALVSTGFGYRRDRRAWQAQVAAGLIPAVRDLRRFGSAALDLCWVAGARVDAYYEWGLNPWDLSAGRLICTEAGGVVEILAGHTIVATTPALARPLTELLLSLGADQPPAGEEPRHW
jgi:myo-inositol-1(or 4)-monophosphatase